MGGFGMKRDDPKALALREEWKRQELRVDILVRGIAKTLEDSCCDRVSHIREVLDIANRELAPALTVLEDAEKAYEPYRSRMRMRRRRLSSAAKPNPSLGTARPN
jgi:hypothetical protein